MFLGRKEEKKQILSFLKGDRGSVLAVYGRRRVGKTSLVIECLKNIDVPVINYTCEKGDYLRNALLFYDRAKEVLKGDYFPLLSSFREIFAYLRNAHKDREMVVFLDEFPYLFNEDMDDPRISEFSAIIDECKDSNLKIILCGSSIHFMNKVFSNYANPLYGRADKFVELRPFSFMETKSFFPDRSFQDIFLSYGISGGIPVYLDILLSYGDVKEAMKEECFYHNGYFYKESGFFLKSEFDDVSGVERILSYLGLREKTTSEIAVNSGYKVNGINYHLNKLEAAYLIEKVENLFGDNKKETRWRIFDPFFAFYYQYIKKNQDFILLSGKDSYRLLWNKEEEALFLSKVYERIAPGIALDLSLKGKLPFVPKTYGKYRGKSSDGMGESIEKEIDGVYCDEKNVLFVECKYRNRLVGKKELEGLIEKSSSVKSGKRARHYMLMSLKGFTEELLEDKPENVFLVKEDRLVC